MTTRLLFIVAVGLSGWATGAPRPVLLREIDLNKYLLDGSASKNHSVQQIVFSPDERWIAIGTGEHGRTPSGDVLVVKMDGSQERVFRIDPKFAAAQGSLHWSPDSDALLVEGGSRSLSFSLPLGVSRELGSDPIIGMILGFVDKEHWLAIRGSADPMGSIMRKERMPFLVFDRMGNSADEWLPPDRLMVESVSAERGLLAVRDGRTHKTSVLDIKDKSVVQVWANRGPRGKQYFAESGKTVCAVDIFGRGALPAQCWDIDTGRIIAEFHDFKGGEPASVSANGSRMILNHIRVYLGLTSEYDLHSFKDRVVWDFRSDRVVAEWAPQFQVVKTGFKAPHDEHTEWAPAAISPTGRYFAEGGNGTVKLYELPPPR